MLKSGILNPPVNSLLSRVRHADTLDHHTKRRNQT
jgi:hypothetical protein